MDKHSPPVLLTAAGPVSMPLPPPSPTRSVRFADCARPSSSGGKPSAASSPKDGDRTLGRRASTNTPSSPPAPSTSAEQSFPPPNAAAAEPELERQLRLAMLQMRLARTHAPHDREERRRSRASSGGPHRSGHSFNGVRGHCGLLLSCGADGRHKENLVVSGAHTLF